MGIDYKKIPSITGEALEFEPDREYVTKALESEYNPVKSESIRSQGHHATRLDIPDDAGHYEARNIKRLSKGKGLLSKLPIVGTALGAGLAALSGEANASSAIPILNEAESLGPESGSEDYEIENPQRNPEARKAALQKLLGNR